jgi:hypothetical protein
MGAPIKLGDEEWRLTHELGKKLRKLK